MAAVTDSNYLAITTVVTIAYQLSFFVIAAGFKFDKVTDFAGTTNFIVLALLTSFLSGTWYWRQVLVTSLVVIWGLRLGLFLLFRILAWGEDHRFDQTRNNVLQFAIFWVFQAVWVWVVSLPVTIVNATVTRNPPLGPVDALGCALWAAGVLLEGAADQQKLRFKADAANRGRWCDVGVWGWSRHPNYCGEILAWVGVLVVSSAVLQGWQWAAVASPLFTATILLFLSGMPLLEWAAVASPLFTVAILLFLSGMPLLECMPCTMRSFVIAFITACIVALVDASLNPSTWRWIHALSTAVHVSLHACPLPPCMHPLIPVSTIPSRTHGRSPQIKSLASGLIIFSTVPTPAPTSYVPILCACLSPLLLAASMCLSAWYVQPSHPAPPWSVRHATSLHQIRIPPRAAHLCGASFHCPQLTHSSRPVALLDLVLGVLESCPVQLSNHLSLAQLSAAAHSLKNTSSHTVL
ncbi:unnamed protein product [Closterium sp. NIES-54]